MILNDHAIAGIIQNENLYVSPKPEPGQLQPASLDVRLDEDVSLEPGETSQPLTKEYFEFPASLAALLTGRSSVARKQCIVHKTAGWIDPGFEGQIMFEMKNLMDPDEEDSETRRFKEGERVGQLIFFPLLDYHAFKQLEFLAKAKKPYDGQFQNQGERK